MGRRRYYLRTIALRSILLAVLAFGGCVSVLILPALAAWPALAQGVACTTDGDIHFKIGALVLRVPRSHNPEVVQNRPIEREPGKSYGKICDYPKSAPASVPSLTLYPGAAIRSGAARLPTLLKYSSVIFRQREEDARCSLPMTPPGVQLTRAAEDGRLIEALMETAAAKSGRYRVFLPPSVLQELSGEKNHRIECRRYGPTPGRMLHCTLTIKLGGETCASFGFVERDIPVKSMLEASNIVENYIKSLLVMNQ